MTEEELLARVIKTIEEVGGAPLFSKDISKDEIDDNDSFFIYVNNAGHERGESPSQLRRKFILSFITKEGGDPNEINLITALKKCGLFFNNTEIDNGKIGNTDQEVSMTTFYFHRIIKIPI